MCFSIFSQPAQVDSSTAPQPNFLQKPISKVALFAATFFLAASAFWAYFAGLGITGIISFSVASLIPFTLLVYAYFQSSEEIQPKDQSTRSSTLSPLEERELEERKRLAAEKAQRDSERAQKENDEREAKEAHDRLSAFQAKQRETLEAKEAEFEKKPISELIDGLTGKEKHFAAKALVKVLSASIQGKDVETAAPLLQVHVDRVKTDNTKLASLLTACVLLDKSPIYLAALLEKLDLPSKDELLPQLLAKLLFSKNYVVARQEGSAAGTKAGDLSAFTLEVYLSPILKEIDDFAGKPLPVALVKAIGEALNFQVANALSGLKKAQEVRGFSIFVHGVESPNFTPSMIRDFLPYLKNIPGLLRLEFDVGSEKVGFTDQEVPVLKEILGSNPFLLSVWFHTAGMSEEVKKDFLEYRQQTLTQHDDTFDHEKLKAALLSNEKNLP